MISNWLGEVLFRSQSLYEKYDLEQLGSLSFSDEQQDILLKRFSAFQQKVTKTEFNRHMLRYCEEILLNKELQNSYAHVIEDFLIFKRCDAPLKALIKLESAVSVFPTLNEGSSPSIKHLWVFEDINNLIQRDHLTNLEGGKEISELYPNLRVFILPPSHFIGKSWKLAFYLAKEALKSNNSNLKKKLAKNWIVTGDVNLEKLVLKIKLGNKIELETTRNWLLPRANHGDWPSNWNPKGTATVVVNIEEAVNRIIGKSVQKEEPINWPSNISNIYSPTSNAETTVIVAAVLCGLNKITLFQSDNKQFSIEPAANIHKFIKKHSNITPVITINKIPSNDIYAIEQFFEREMHLDKTTAETDLTILHITTGNKLMLLAASSIAKRYPNVWLVYRDRGLNKESSTDYIAINYEGLQPTTRTLKADSKIWKKFSGTLTQDSLISLLSSSNIENYIKNKA